MENIKFLKNAVTAEIVEKKSRFIAALSPVRNEEEALGFIASVKKKHYDARHNCYAYITKETERSSDDGEPAHTAGRPMLDILKSEGLMNVCAVVTRYFGGVLLGTGGLVRAYQGAVSAAIKEAELYTLSEKLRYTATCDYTANGKLSYYAESNSFLIDNIRWGSDVSFDIYIDPDRDAEFKAAFTSVTMGRGALEFIGRVYK